ncbi:hypothetical protein B296_00046730 [Ensete ventricosum]|uniref:Uncharacterized protein n=1 Tax=Ensete ventricosum TaxID=4639 RepID=A0A426X2W4_ENSVE|nr:hypothetical protein B296_00046730 [Ensete ventricosum]
MVAVIIAAQVMVLRAAGDRLAHGWAGTVPTSGASMGAAPLRACRRQAPPLAGWSWAGHGRALPLRAGRPYRGHDHGLSPYFLVGLATKTQQECVEYFYAI